MEENQTINELDNKPNTEGGSNAAPLSTNKKSPVKWGAVFGLFMIFIYFGMAYLTICTDYFFWIVDWARYGLGIIFVGYGLWRGYRYIKS